MAQEPRSRKPRVRRTAPTVRERQLAAAAQADAEPGWLRKAAANTAKPMRALRITQRKPARALGRIFRPLRWLLAKIAPKYLINSWREVRQVVWPARRETWRLTLAVFIFAIVFGALVAGVDKGLDEIFKKVVLK